jgi:hypothetical protein
MQLNSPAFADTFPVKYSKDGENISPPFSWVDTPPQTAEFALFFENVAFAGRENFVHWLVYGIPASVGELPEGFKHTRDPKEPRDILQGLNGLGDIGYDGPAGTVGKRVKLRATLLAVEKPLNLPEGAGMESLMSTAEDKVVASSQIETVYERAPVHG